MAKEAKQDNDSKPPVTDEESTDAKKKDKKSRDSPPTKVIIRQLPPNLTEESLLEQISPVPEYNYFQFCRADSSLGSNASCRAYINFIKFEDILPFQQKFDGYVFIDSKGNEYQALVEFAPYQKVALKKARKLDPKKNTIDQDSDFKRFLASLENPEPLVQPTPEGLLEELETRERELKALSNQSTPLIDYIKKRKDEKRQTIIRAREERKRKEIERRKLREDDTKRRRDRDRDRYTDRNKSEPTFKLLKKRDEVDEGGKERSGHSKQRDDDRPRKDSYKEKARDLDKDERYKKDHDGRYSKKNQDSDREYKEREKSGQVGSKSKDGRPSSSDKTRTHFDAGKKSDSRFNKDERRSGKGDRDTYKERYENDSDYKTKKGKDDRYLKTRNRDREKDRQRDRKDKEDTGKREKSSFSKSKNEYSTDNLLDERDSKKHADRADNEQNSRPRDSGKKYSRDRVQRREARDKERLKKDDQASELKSGEDVQTTTSTTQDVGSARKSEESTIKVVASDKKDTETKEAKSNEGVEKKADSEVKPSREKSGGSSSTREDRGKSAGRVRYKDRPERAIYVPGRRGAQRTKEAQSAKPDAPRKDEVKTDKSSKEGDDQ